MNQDNGNGRNANSNNMKDTPEIEEELKPLFENVSLTANVHPTSVEDVDENGITLGSYITTEATHPVGDYTLVEVMWDMAVRAKKSDTLVNQSDEIVLFSDHKGCPKCSNVVHDPDGEHTICGSCDNDQEFATVNFPDKMKIEETLEFPDHITPVQSNDELEQALRLVFDTTKISL